ncbi:uncharacterized protein LOC123472256 [Daphnia magna]|uniref:uncharacterized protein LOC123472256 n=1 Tax=Daphnia magna TaxID=35525 RepID=UPI001E1BA717|nr:uncharacterized protein LOC123472256 [Daphnia magna]
MEFPENIPGCILDEIALEGLEGLTISTLWIRLTKRQNFPIALDDQSKRFIWKIIFVMTNVLEQHKKPIQISKVLECVQAARRLHQFNYHKSVNVPGMAGNGDEEDNVEKLEENEVISLVKQRTKSIVEALENYREL